MYQLTPCELQVLEEASTLAIEELEAAQEDTDYVLTVGALEACQEALIIIKAIRDVGAKSDKAYSDTGLPS